MAKDDKTKAPAKAGETGKKAEVRGPVGGRWRGGLHFTPEVRVVDLGELDAADFEAITADPLLSVKLL